ncbi:uncharacterized protein RJT21DRAFT_118917 [Scheffersomyces amazonensis]|uniref:uncharacterized protein n=1 Tax=Scheffersomyces amazonensis TaxID=1078765 RepID=UPI00315CF2EE
MLRYTHGCTVVRPLQQWRGLFVMASEKKPVPKKSYKRKPKESQSQSYKDLTQSSGRISRIEETVYKKRLAELRQLTKTLSANINRIEEHKKERNELSHVLLPSQIEKSVDQVHKSISSDTTTSNSTTSTTSTSTTSTSSTTPTGTISPHLLIVPTMKIPDSVAERLGLSLKYLVNEKSQNWPRVLEELKKSEGFKGLNSQTVTAFIACIPQKHLVYLIPELQALLNDANIKLQPSMIHLFMKGVAYGTTINDTSIAILESYYKRLESLETPRLSTFELMIKAYGKCNRMIDINKMLLRMKQLGLETNKTVLSNLLSTCVYKARDHNQAIQIFDSMKFFSKSTNPGTKEYQDMIVSYINNDDIEKALDLYQEMLKDNIDINQSIMVALARGCYSREIFRYKAWDFMFEIRQHGWTPTLETFEYMLYLSAKDGDLALARALYANLLSSNSTSARSFSLMLVGYAKSSYLSSTGYKPPLISFNENGRVFRRNIISEFLKSNTDELPLLPIEELTTSQQILAESSALWAYTQLNNPQFINKESTTSYLNIAAEVGTMDDFKYRYNSATYLNEEGLAGTRTIIEEPEETEPEAQPQPKEIIKSPMLTQIEQRKSEIKVPRVPLTYHVALKAAAKFKDYQFAQQVWQERGKFRKTSSFRELSRTEKDKSDFEFASSMVLALTKMNMLNDALAIVLSTEYQFKWSWRQLSQLNEAAKEIGSDVTSQTLYGIVRRSQIKHNGKMRRKDYKLYLLNKKDANSVNNVY